jgi:ABC-2 type transport system ATP-binding protein
LLILDEPTIGLDPTQVVEVRRLIERLAQDTTILLSTHILSEVEAMCDRVIILINGEVRADSRLSELEAPAGVVLVLGAGAPDAAAELRALSGVQAVEAAVTGDGTAYHVRGPEGKDLRPAIYDLARERAWPLHELRLDVRTLEAVFNEMATTATRDKQPSDSSKEVEA